LALKSVLKVVCDRASETGNAATDRCVLSTEAISYQLNRRLSWTVR
jgi:hypothetical protein